MNDPTFNTPTNFSADHPISNFTETRSEFSKV